MTIVYDSKEMERPIDKCVMTIGNFDGIHIGHQKIFKKVKEKAQEIGGTSAIYTFDPHPLSVFQPERSPFLITTFDEKVELIDKVGIDLIVCESFTREFADIDPDQFVEAILVNKLGLKWLFVGHDFAFGKGRKGTIDMLLSFAEKYQFHIETMDAIREGSKIVSSTRVRDCIIEGRMDETSQLLGRFYGLKGRVTEGKKRGKDMGFPTANIVPEKKIIPKIGVYATRILLEGRRLDGAANVGYNPTFSNDKLSVEAFIFDFNEEIYGKEIVVEFVKRLRDEKKFESHTQLVEQIKKDVDESKAILAKLH